MNSRIASALGYAVAAAAAVLAAAPQHARADDPTIDPNRFVSTESRADVRADIIKHPAGSVYNEWDSQQNERTPFRSSFTRADSRAGYLQSRDEVRQFTGEDSGASYLKRTPRNPTTMMGAPAQ